MLLHVNIYISYNILNIRVYAMNATASQPANNIIIIFVSLLPFAVVNVTVRFAVSHTKFGDYFVTFFCILLIYFHYHAH